MHGKGKPDSPFVQHELQDIRDMCEFEARNKDVTYLELFKPNMIFRTHVGIFMQIWSQRMSSRDHQSYQLILTTSLSDWHECHDVCLAAIVITYHNVLTNFSGTI